jgi:hypothetical protein
MCKYKYAGVVAGLDPKETKRNAYFTNKDGGMAK